MLRPDELARHARLRRLPCDPDLDAVVENYWTLRWSLPAGQEHPSSTLPHPAATLSVERGAVRAEAAGGPVVVTGVITRRFDVMLRDTGWVFAAKFRPGGLARLTGVSAASSRDRTVAARSLFPAATVSRLDTLDDQVEDQDCAGRFDEALTALPLAPDPDHALVLDVVGDMLADRSLLRVDQVARRHGVGMRRLQRLFAHYVGASPKWVLARYRLHDAVTELDEGPAGTLADLAARHGWYDQAHFTREFVRLVGVTPGEYVAPMSDPGSHLRAGDQP